jgi:hypothetical protein
MADVDQAAPQQSIEDRIGNHLFGDADPVAEDAAEESTDESTDDSADQAEDQPADVQKSSAVEELEVEFDGWKGKIPAKLKAEIDKGADYTRKTQVLADEKRLFDIQARTNHEQQQFMQSAGKELDQYRQIENQLEQYRTVDLSQIDGETLSRMSMAAANLREERAKLKETLDAKREQFRNNMLGAWDEMTSKARDVIVKSVPNWDSIAGQVAQYALNEGFPFEHITGHDRQTRERVGPGVVDPVFAKTLYKAMQWDKLQTSKATTTGKVANAPPVLKPGAVDNRSSQQVGLTNFKKALKTAGSDARKADLIGERLASKFFR